MSDISYIVLALVTSLGFLLGVAFWLQKRNKPSSVHQKVHRGDPSAEIWLWYVRILVSILVLLVVATFVFRNLTIFWFALVFVGSGWMIGYAYRFYRIVKMGSSKK